MKILKVHAKNDAIGVRVATIRGQALKEIRRRLKGAKRDVLALYESIPRREYYQVEIVNDLVANKKYYEYDKNPERLENIYVELRQIIDGWLDTSTDKKPARYFLDLQMGQSYQYGTERSIARLDQITDEAFRFEQILFSQPYADRIANVRARMFENMKGFSGDTSKDLGQALANIVADGMGVTKAKKLIAKRFDVSESRAERIVRTEINKSYTDSRTQATKQARDEMGINVAVMHESAFAPTTRIEHAERSGNIYTPEQQEAWWNEGANRINCLCSVVEVLLDDDGEIIQKDLQTKLKDEKKQWLAGMSGRG